MAIPADKQSLRDTFRQRRRDLEPATRKKCAEAFTKRALTWFKEYASSAKVIGGYYPLPEEMDVLPLLKSLLKQGRVISFPAVVEKRGLVFRKVQDTSARRFEKHSSFGVMEPTVAFPEVTPEVILVPMIAFDGACNRLGFGAAHYDRAIAALRKGKHPVRAVGVAFECQRAPFVPLEKHDQRLDVVITERMVYRPPANEDEEA